MKLVFLLVCVCVFFFKYVFGLRIAIISFSRCCIDNLHEWGKIGLCLLTVDVLKVNVQITWVYVKSLNKSLYLFICVSEFCKHIRIQLLLFIILLLDLLFAHCDLIDCCFIFRFKLLCLRIDINLCILMECSIFGVSKSN